MYLYIFFEITYLTLIFINFILNKYSEVFCIGPVIISIIYILINKINKEKVNIYLLLSLIFSLSGDIFFLLIDNNILGIASFIIVQMYYYFYLKNKSCKLYLLVLLNFIMCLIISSKILIIECIFYVIIFILNIFLSIKYLKNKKISLLFVVALFSLLICDINIAIISKINLSKCLKILCSSIEWVSYTLNLILITLLASRFFNSKGIY